MAEHIEREKLNNLLDEYTVLDGLYNAIQAIPAADVAPVVHGHWESDQGLFEMQMARCSKCKTESYLQSLIEVGGDELPNYCPNCGARMELQIIGMEDEKE